MGLRDYQQWAVDEVWRYFEQNDGNPVIVMPVGTGKSHVISGLIRSMMVAFPTTRCMILTHVKELIAQNYAKFLETWPNAPAGVYSAGLDRKEYIYPITFGGIASVAKNADLFGHIDIVFIDECDLVSNKDNTMYRKFLKELAKVNPKLKIIGLTATHWRTGSGLITEADNGLFTDVCVDMSSMNAFNWFIEQGYLIPLVGKPTRLVLETDSLHIRMGDFIEKEMQVAYDKEELTREVVRECLDVGHDRKKWLVFGAGVQHCHNIVQELALYDRESVAIYDGMGKKQRDEAIAAYKHGELSILVNNNILTAGFDVPAIDMLVVMRATASSRLWVQMLGRGDRPLYADGFDLATQEGRLCSIAASEKQNCLVMDFTRNIERLGPINDPTIPRKGGKKTGQPAPVKVCPVCDQYVHASARYCGGKPANHPEFNRANGCGNEFQFEVKFKASASTKDIIKQDELPIVETFKVDHITYSTHHKVGSPPIMRVTYYCGLKAFSDYVCLEHTVNSPGRNRANRWWRERDMEGDSIPQSVNDALERATDLKCPTHLDVWTNTKYPQIKRYCYDGTAFGTQTADDPRAATVPQVDVKLERKATQYAAESYDESDDDIPF